MSTLKCGLYLNVFLGYILVILAVEDGDDTTRYFVKDSGMTMKFPPQIVRSIFPEIPIGHLRSLGYQRVSDGSVQDIKTVIEPKEFYTKYAIKNIPITLRNIVDERQPIRSMWTDERLQKMHGLSKVWAIKRHERSSKTPMKITLERFLEFYKLQDVYLATTIPEELMTEIVFPKFLNCGPILRHLVEAELWMGYGGTGSLLHYHGDHQVHCMADGRKDFILIENKHKKTLKMIEKHPFTGEGYSNLDTEMVNMFVDKYIADIPWIYTTLLAGDCLFIPAGYIHQVRSYGRSLSYTLQFSSSHDDSIDICQQPENDEYKFLEEYDFLYTERNGIEQLKNKKLTGEDMRNVLLKLLRKASMLPFERFQHFYNTAIGKVKQKMPSARSVFNNLDDKSEGFITLKQIKDVPTNQLLKVAKILNSIHKATHDEL